MAPQLRDAANVGFWIGRGSAQMNNGLTLVWRDKLKMALLGSGHLPAVLLRDLDYFDH
jgi:hypothetical protein